MKLRLPVFVLLLLMVIAKSYGQDPSFSQVVNTSSYTHPSNVTMNKRVAEVHIAYRKQWMSFDKNDFTTAYGSIDMPFPGSGMGMGLQFMQDGEGMGKLKTQFAKGVIRYNLLHYKSKSKQQAIAAIDIGYGHKSINTTGLIFSNNLNPVFGVTGTTNSDNGQLLKSNYLDMGFSFSYINENMDLSRILNNDMAKNYRIPVTTSISLHHINRPTETLLGVNTRLPVNFAGTLRFAVCNKKAESIHLRNIVFQYEQQATIKKSTFGIEMDFAGDDSPVNVYAGAYYANGIINQNFAANTDAYTFLAGFEFGDTDRYNIGISYDYNNRGLSTQTGGVVEVTLNISARNLFKTIVNCFAYPTY